MKIYEVTQPKSKTIVFEDSVDSKVDLVKVKSAWNRFVFDTNRTDELPLIWFSQHGEDRKDHGRDDNDPTTNITNIEMLRFLDRTMNKYAKEIMSMPSNYEGVLQDSNSDINVPFVVKHKPDGRTELVAKTIMKEPNFRAGGNVFRV